MPMRRECGNERVQVPTWCLSAELEADVNSDTATVSVIKCSMEFHWYLKKYETMTGTKFVAASCDCTATYPVRKRARTSSADFSLALPRTSTIPPITEGTGSATGATSMI